MYKSRTDAINILEHLQSSISDDNTSKAIAAIYLFDFLDYLSHQSFPENWLSILEKRTDELINVSEFIVNRLERDGMSSNLREIDINESFEYRTGEVYFRLWNDFDEQEYYDKTSEMLLSRFELNGIQINKYNNALDDGCGSGRYTIALKKIGCSKVTGIDVSGNSIEFAKDKNIYQGNVDFKQGSVLDLPFEDESFDLVFSNGVLHHTSNTKKGLEEIFRVLRPGGGCWLYLYGGKGSFFWDVVETCRSLLSDIPQIYTMNLMKVLGYSSGRIFHRNDFFYVPVNNRYLVSELEEMLLSVGFNQSTRLLRGAAHDWDEIIHANKHIDPYIYGEGELRYWIEKS
jgi:ubiquinone/menaquinone biosynthesis C-methylase UbiE